MKRVRHAWSMLTWKPTWHRVFYGGREYLIHRSALTFDPELLQFRWDEPWHIGGEVGAGNRAAAAFLARVSVGSLVSNPADHLIVSLDVA